MERLTTSGPYLLPTTHCRKKLRQDGEGDVIGRHLQRIPIAHTSLIKLLQCRKTLRISYKIHICVCEYAYNCACFMLRLYNAFT